MNKHRFVSMGVGILLMASVTACGGGNAAESSSGAAHYVQTTMGTPAWVAAGDTCLPVGGCVWNGPATTTVRVVGLCAGVLFTSPNSNSAIPDTAVVRYVGGAWHAMDIITGSSLALVDSSPKCDSAG